MSSSKKSVAYFYDPDVGNFHYGPGHPMKPHRIRMTHNLVMSYELYKRMSIYRAAPASCQEMTQFHSDDYVDFLNRVTPENASHFQRELERYNFEDDCPVFDGMFDLFSLSAGSSMEGAARLNRGLSDICINWSGGLHHAKKCEASGFCYINDIVLAILELLRHHKRVLYIDIDVHHGDGVEEAFYTTDRVMTCSFHKYGEFFPGTGDLRDIGESNGKYYAVNFPLRDGIDDLSYQSVFQPVIQHIMDWYQPNAVVLQCGTDSLAGDKLGCFNLSMDGHAECVRFVKGFNLPTLVLGGGGYTIRNVSRVWAYETGILVGSEMDRKLPMNDYMDYYAPEYSLNVPAYNVENSNSPEYLERIKHQVLMNLEHTKFAPSIQMQDVPRDRDNDNVDEDMLNPDERMPESMRDQHVVPDTEMHEADSIGLMDGSRDGTKVLNEESNEKPPPEPIQTNDGDVEMTSAPASADSGPLAKETLGAAVASEPISDTVSNTPTTTTVPPAGSKPQNSDPVVSTAPGTAESDSMDVDDTPEKTVSKKSDDTKGGKKQPEIIAKEDPDPSKKAIKQTLSQTENTNDKDTVALATPIPDSKESNLSESGPTLNDDSQQLVPVPTKDTSKEIRKIPTKDIENPLRARTSHEHTSRDSDSNIDMDAGTDNDSAIAKGEIKGKSKQEGGLSEEKNSLGSTKSDSKSDSRVEGDSIPAIGKSSAESEEKATESVKNSNEKPAIVALLPLTTPISTTVSTATAAAATKIQANAQKEQGPIDALIKIDNQAKKKTDDSTANEPPSTINSTSFSAERMNESITESENPLESTSVIPADKTEKNTKSVSTTSTAAPKTTVQVIRTLPPKPAIPIQVTAEKEEGEATEDDEDEEGEIKDTP